MSSMYPKLEAGNTAETEQQPSVKFRKDQQEQNGDPEKTPVTGSEEADGFWTAARWQYLVFDIMVHFNYT